MPACKAPSPSVSLMGWPTSAGVNPAVAVAAGVAFLSEPFTVTIAVSFALILAGSMLATGLATGAARGSGDRCRIGYLPRRETTCLEVTWTCLPRTCSYPVGTGYYSARGKMPDLIEGSLQ